MIVKPEKTQEQERIIQALKGAVEGVCCAMEQGTITATQIDCLFQLIIGQLNHSFK